MGLNINLKDSLIMKTFFLTISIILSSALFISCSSNDDEPTPPSPPIEENHPIVGKWNLIELYLSWDPNPIYYYEPGDIVWNFKPDNILEIFVKEGIEPEDSFSQGVLGDEYIYLINETDDTVSLAGNYYPDWFIKSPMNLNENTLILGGGTADDGFLYVFEK